MSELITNLNNILDIKGNIKSAIENKGVDMTGVSFPGYASKIGEISGGGGVKPSGTLEISENGVFDVYSYASANVNVPMTGFDEREVTEGKLNIVNLNNSASFVKNNVFGNNNYIQTVNLPDCYEVKEAAFSFCANLTSVNLPQCFSIGSSAFRNCSSLSQVNLPTVKTTSALAFNNCSSLTSLTLCTDVYWTVPLGTRTYGGTPIITVSSSASIYVRSDTYSLWVALTGWSSISDKFVSVPVSGPALSFSNGLVSGTTKAIASDFTSYLSVTASDITNVLLPECKYLYDLTFQSCTSLNQVNLPVCSYIGDGAFLNCNLFSSITIGYSSICSLGGSNAFSATPIASGTGSIYVPASLVDTYKTATNWSLYSTQIFPIPE